MSLYLRRKKNNRIWTEISFIIAALLLGGSFFASILSQLRLTWSLSTAFEGGLISGLISCWNEIADMLGNTNFVILTKYDGGSEGYGLFLTLTLVVLLVIAYLIVRSGFTPGVFLFVIPQILIGLFFSIQPSTGLILFSAGSVIAALVVMKMKGGLLQALIPATIAVLLSFVLFLAAGSDQSLFAGTADKTVLGTWTGDLLFGKDDLGHGDLTKRKRSIRDGEALSVTMTQPQSMYLKGFTGSVFTGRSWNDLTNTTYYQAEDMMEALRQADFFAKGQLAQSAQLAYDDLSENTITISNTGADSRVIFVPYDLTNCGDLESMVTKGGSLFYTGKLGHSRSYTYTAVENQVDNWTDAAGRFFTLALGGDTSAEEYLIPESYYNAFVYENYTQLSVGDKKILAANIGSEGDQSQGHMDYKVAITAIRTYLEDNFIYSEDLGEADANISQLKVFLDSKKGYDVQFATAATLMFRYYGIPARYAEGYLITPEDAKNAQEGTISVPRERTHAWTEIYVDGIGFVPLEVTPEFYGMMEEADMTVGISNDSLMSNYEDLFGNRGKGNRGEEDEDNNNTRRTNGGDDALQLLWKILVVVAAAAALAVLVLLIRKLLLLILAASRRRKLFYKSEPKLAVAAIYGYIDKLGLSPDEETIDLGNRAAYSRQEIKEEERQNMLEKLKNLKKQKNKSK